MIWNWLRRHARLVDCVLVLMPRARATSAARSTTASWRPASRSPSRCRLPLLWRRRHAAAVLAIVVARRRRRMRSRTRQLAPFAAALAIYTVASTPAATPGLRRHGRRRGRASCSPSGGATVRSGQLIPDAILFAAALGDRRQPRCAARVHARARGEGRPARARARDRGGARGRRGADADRARAARRDRAQPQRHGRAGSGARTTSSIRVPSARARRCARSRRRAAARSASCGGCSARVRDGDGTEFAPPPGLERARRARRAGAVGRARAWRSASRGRRAAADRASTSPPTASCRRR